MKFGYKGHFPVKIPYVLLSELFRLTCMEEALFAQKITILEAPDSSQCPVLSTLLSDGAVVS